MVKSEEATLFEARMPLNIRAESRTQFIQIGGPNVNATDHVVVTRISSKLLILKSQTESLTKYVHATALCQPVIDLGRHSAEFCFQLIS
jgi:hypothetical protein